MNKSNLTMSEYHQHTEFVSASSLKELRKSPAHFLEAWKGSREQTPAMAKGEFLHSVILEQDISKYAKRPVNEDGSLVRSNSKEFKEWEASLGAKSAVDPYLYDEALNLLSAFSSHSEAMKLYNGAKVELSIFGEAPNGLKIKGRPDILGANYIADYKTTSNMDRFERDIWTMGYYIQAAQYVFLAEQEFKTKILHFDFIAQETAKPYGIKVFRLGPKELAHARDEWMQLINQAKIRIDEGVFPSYDESIKQVQIPEWFFKSENIFDEVG